MALLVTLFLVLVNIFNAITTNSPKADGLNALQAWIITCIFFVFGALLEYSVILLRLKIISLRQRLPVETEMKRLNGGNRNPLVGPGENNGDVSAPENLIGIMKKNESVGKWDLVCLVAFPIVFVVFAVFYTTATIAI